MFGAAAADTPAPEASAAMVAAPIKKLLRLEKLIPDPSRLHKNCYGHDDVCSPIRAANDGHQLLNLLALVRLVPGGDRMFHAMRNVIVQDLFFQSA